MRPETRDVLELWVKMANRIRSWGLWQGFQKGDELSLSFRLDGDSNSLSGLRYGGPLPEDETMAATMLKVRLLLQNREDFSLKRLEEVSDDPSLSDDWKRALAQAQSDIERQMEASGGIPDCVSPRTTRRVYDVFTYGDGAHHNQRYVFQEWEKSSQYPLLQWIFVATFAQMCCHILNLAELAEQELRLTPPNA